MTVDYYSDEYRRYSTYVRNYDRTRPIYKIACGPLDADYNWTDVMMKKCGKLLNGLSLHYYARNKKYPHYATEFNESEYREILELAYRMESIVHNHSEIMNRYDPDKRVGFIVDEWGTWYNVEPGTNPGFLYQQNSMRDAVVAAMTLNIFNKHCDRVQMANIAQTVNVLQAVILTDGEEMLLTPTYHVYKLFREHQENKLLGSYITSKACYEGSKVPQLIESASIKEDGTIISTIVNTSSTEAAEIQCQIADFNVSEISAEILHGEMTAHNTFDAKENVKICAFTDLETTIDGFKTIIPPCSIVKFEIK